MTDLGVFVNCPHPEMVEAIALSGFDFAVVDMEHTPIGPGDLYSMVLAAERRDLSLVVRIPERSAAYFKWCGDLNVRCVQVPHIETAADVTSAIQQFFFSPKGERGLSRFVRAADFSSMDKDDFIAKTNGLNRLILQVEGRQALENLDAILERIPEEASIFIGPYDLSQSLGLPGEIWHENVVNSMMEIVEKCRVRGIRVGTFADSMKGLHYWMDQGVNFLEFASELHILMEAGRRVVSDFRAGKN